MRLTHPNLADPGPRPRPRYEVADIFRAYGPSYREAHSLPLLHLKVMRAIEICRTAELGGHLERCDGCGFERPAYNSCRNRHCPKCQALAKAEWLDRRKAELLPVEYFHNVFTLPHELNGLAGCNPKVIYDLLFQSVASTLREFGADPRHGLGGQIGFTAVLHTWDQKLLPHLHLHCLIPAGALSFDRHRWIATRTHYLFPVKALSKLFRGKFIEDLQRAFRGGKLLFPGALAPLVFPKDFRKFIRPLWEKEWVVYSKPSFHGPESVLDYLGRYTHRVAIANHRIVNLDAGRVTFRYWDRSDQNQVKALTLEAPEFIRRFLWHVLPGFFQRIRHFGFLANRGKGRGLARCRELLGSAPLSPNLQNLPNETRLKKLARLIEIDPWMCPRCKKGHMQRVTDVPKINRVFFRVPSRSPKVWDTS